MCPMHCVCDTVSANPVPEESVPLRVLRSVMPNDICGNPSTLKPDTKVRNRSVKMAYRRLELHRAVIKSVYSLLLAPPLNSTATSL